MLDDSVQPALLSAARVLRVEVRLIVTGRRCVTHLARGCAPTCLHGGSEPLRHGAVLQHLAAGLQQDHSNPAGTLSHHLHARTQAHWPISTHLAGPAIRGFVRRDTDVQACAFTNMVPCPRLGAVEVQHRSVLCHATVPWQLLPTTCATVSDRAVLADHGTAGCCCYQSYAQRQGGANSVCLLALSQCCRSALEDRMLVRGAGDSGALTVGPGIC